MSHALAEISLTPSVFVFNPFAEGYIAQGKAFNPVKHQALLAEDLENLPQFLGQPGDVVLLPKRPSLEFLNGLRSAGLPLPEFVELKSGRIAPGSSLCHRQLGSLRPWAWAPDSIKLFEPLFARVENGPRTATQYFNDDIARLYSKAWSADFLRKVLARWRQDREASSRPAEAQSDGGAAAGEPWLCSEQESGTAVDTIEGALEAIAAIRHRGHHRVVVKESLGAAGHNALRLWEPEVLPTQRQWLAHAFTNGPQLVVEPWLERELDFSVQLEMGPRGLALCGYTGLVNDAKGQFLANWAEADYARRLPTKVAALLGAPAEVSGYIHRLYATVFALLEAEVRRVGFVGPIGIDAFVYRAPQGDCRLKPVVEINPRYTLGRLTLELMKYAGLGSRGVFRLVNRAQARAAGFADFPGYARFLGTRFPLSFEADPVRSIRRGVICLNDPAQAQVCLATFAVNTTDEHG